MDASTLSIGEVARRAGVGVETVRFYEREGLVPEPPRSPSGYRQYPFDTVRRIFFLKQAKALGFTLKEIRELLGLRVAPHRSCAEVRALALSKLDQVERRLQELEHMRAALHRLASWCTDAGATGECPMLDALDSEGRSDGEG